MVISNTLSFLHSMVTSPILKHISTVMVDGIKSLNTTLQNAFSVIPLVKMAAKSLDVSSHLNSFTFFFLNF